MSFCNFSKSGGSQLKSEQYPVGGKKTRLYSDRPWQLIVRVSAGARDLSLSGMAVACSCARATGFEQPGIRPDPGDTLVI